MVDEGPERVRIESAAQRLRDGHLVAFPTETVYGLGADARNIRAVAQIFALKGRPADHPLIVHLARAADVMAWARKVPDSARALMERFWPGPLTLVFARHASVPDAISGGQDTIALRCPAHPVAQALLQAFAGNAPDTGVAAPSANRFGRVSPTTAMHVQEEFGDRVFTLDGGACTVGIESTILDLSRTESVGPVLLRPGIIDLDALAAILGELPRRPDRHAPRVPGALAAHYSPATPLRLVAADSLAQAPTDVAVWSRSVSSPRAHRVGWERAPQNVEQYARELYAALRRLDTLGAREIWVERPPEGKDWAGVTDRLERAAFGSGNPS